MKIYKVPYDVKREEKIFGGYLSLRQVLYIMLSASSLSILAIKIPLIFKISFIGIFSILFLLCAFLKINEQNFDNLLFYGLKYLFRKKNYIYERRDKI